MLLLLMGDFAQGWQEYEWRWQTRQFKPTLRHFAATALAGESASPGHHPAACRTRSGRYHPVHPLRRARQTARRHRALRMSAQPGPAAAILCGHRQDHSVRGTAARFRRACPAHVAAGNPEDNARNHTRRGSVSSGATPNCGLRIADCGFKCSACLNPQSAIRNPRFQDRRRLARKSQDVGCRSQTRRSATFHSSGAVRTARPCARRAAHQPAKGLRHRATPGVGRPVSHRRPGQHVQRLQRHGGRHEKPRPGHQRGHCPPLIWPGRWECRCGCRCRRRAVGVG